MSLEKEWARWHRERVSALTAPYGPLFMLSARDTPPSDPSPLAPGGLLRVPLVASGTPLTTAQRLLAEQEGTVAGEPDYGSIEVFRPHPDHVVPARFTSSDDSGLDGTLSFSLGGHEHQLVVSRQPRGDLHATFGDPSRQGVFPYRFVQMPEPDERGDTVIDFNRVVLPIAAFSSRPPEREAPPQNQLTVALEAGEHRWLT